MSFDEKPPPPPAPDVQRVDKDGKPTVAWTDWERRMHSWLDRFSAQLRFGTPFTPSTATIAAAGAVNRTIATMVAPAAMTGPITWAVTRNVGNLAIKFTGAALQSSANPIGPVGTYYVEVQATDSASHILRGDLQVTLT